MSATFYRWIRDLHLYLGLFISPFILVFAISVFFLVHSWLPNHSSAKPARRVVADLALPADLEKLSGRPLIEALKPALAMAGVHGEVGYVQHRVKEGVFVIPVMVPGRETSVLIDIARREAAIETQEKGLASALVVLHESPGQHLAAIRMNWWYMRVWRWLADATVYLIAFTSVSGIYLWYVLRAERIVGIVLLSAGAITFFGLAYALAH